jgi:2-polyprenyl-3-methyl-5-hydroxy-6-metoxy-1,4-benzoquinol methylase
MELGGVARGPWSESVARAAEIERADAWSDTFESGYDAEAETPHDFVLNGWESSVSGERFDRQEVFDWRDSVAAAIRGLDPRGILEVGSGGGLMTHALAPTVDRYLATDPAAAGLRRLGTALGRAGVTDVRLDQVSGHEIGRHAGEGYDCVLMTTVVQYFPSAAYLRRVIDAALSVVGEAGLVFLADLRHPEADLGDRDRGGRDLDGRARPPRRARPRGPLRRARRPFARRRAGRRAGP